MIDLAFTFVFLGVIIGNAASISNGTATVENR